MPPGEGSRGFIHLIMLTPFAWDLGILSAFMAFIEPGDEVIVFEPFFDQ